MRKKFNIMFTDSTGFAVLGSPEHISKLKRPLYWRQVSEWEMLDYLDIKLGRRVMLKKQQLKASEGGGGKDMFLKI